jgi:hypothetical protein
MKKKKKICLKVFVVTEIITLDQQRITLSLIIIILLFINQNSLISEKIGFVQNALMVFFFNIIY